MKRGAPDPNLPPPSGPDRLALLVATGLGSGYSPFASGTAGTLVAIPIYLAVASLAPWLQVLTTVAFVALAVHAADRAAVYFGHTDDGRIVSDEIAGYLVTMALVPPTPLAVAAGFVLFRVADIFKPWPASWFDRRVHSGLGNVMDDVCAGLWARLALGVLVTYWPG